MHPVLSDGDDDDHSSQQNNAIHFVDAVADELNGVTKEEEQDDILLCNSVQMIREKLKIEGSCLFFIPGCGSVVVSSLPAVWVVRVRYLLIAMGRYARHCGVMTLNRYKTYENAGFSRVV